MSVQLAELKLRRDAKEPAVPQQAFRVRAFLDNQWVSQGWLVPGRGATNASGQLVYEPVVVLDPSARAALTAAKPPAAPETPSSITVNHNYPTTTETVWPAIWIAGGGHHQRPDPPVELPPRFPPQPKPQPQPVSPFLSTRIWQPQTGCSRCHEAGREENGSRRRPGGIRIYRVEQAEAFRAEAAPIPSPPAIERVVAYRRVAGGGDRDRDPVD